MQASTSKAAYKVASSTISHFRTPAARLASVRCASTSAGRKGRKGKAPPEPPAPNEMPLKEALRTLRALLPGDKTSAYELVLHSRLAQSVNINSLRGRSFLAHDASSGKKKETILVFAEGEQAERARAEGADIVGGKELIDEVLNSTVSPTKIICTPDFLPLITRSGLPRILGPKGLMPSTKRGTVTADIGKAVQEAKGALDWMGVEIGSPKSKRKESIAMVSVPIGRLTFTPQQVEENIRQFTKEVIDVSNGVGTQAELDLRASGSNKKKMAGIEKMFLGTTKTMSLVVTDLPGQF